MPALDGFSLSFVSLSITAKTNSRIVWNSFPGSVIHGIIGFRLKELSCVVKHGDCKKCHLVHSCAYGTIYESPVPPNSKRMKLYPQTPHPIRITVYPWDKPFLKAGETFEIGVILYGRAVSNLLMVLLSLDTGLQAGVGRVVNGQRGLATMVEVADSIDKSALPWEVLKKRYHAPAETRNLSEVLSQKYDGDLKLRFVSPLKIAVNEKISFNPRPRDIAVNLIRRIGNLSAFFGGGEYNQEVTELIAEAESVEYSSTLKRIAAIRYSSRQSKTISMSGALGEMIIRNCPADLARILAMGKYTGIGKGTTMGLGDYRLENSPENP